MNVLVYSGPEVLNASFARTISLLKATLVPHYAVQPVTLQSLTSNPWSDTCALLVIPACREQLSLPSSVRIGIKTYVEGGGSLLGLRASARIVGSGFISAELYESSFRFQDRSSGTSISCTFVGGPGAEEKNVTRVALRSNLGTSSVHLPVDDVLGEFSIPGNSTNADILVYNGEDSTKVFSISCRAGEGHLLFWTLDLASSGSKESTEIEAIRRTLLDESLQHLGLKVPAGDHSVSLHPLPQFLTCSPSRPTIVGQVIESLSSVLVSDTLKDEHDTFTFHSAVEGRDVLYSNRLSSFISDPEVKHIITYSGGHLPSSDDTHLFDISQFYADLTAARSKSISPVLSTNSWGIGEALLYGEVVTSTQTMLDKNQRFLSSLPHPLLSLASHQVAGRGRGGNNWVSPAGCLQFSLLLRVPLKDVPAPKLVFLQYLFALAVVEACRDPDILGPIGEHVRIKWPNDLYVVQGDQRRKVGGILVHTSFQGGVTTIVIGCGINVLNSPPIPSLTQLGTPPRPLTMERAAATIMATFEPMWNTFVAARGSFQPFMDLYLERWLHSDQQVTITSTTPHLSVRVVGITEDYGLLRTIPERRAVTQQEFVDLQPDGNSFDLMSGLIMAKSASR